MKNEQDYNFLYEFLNDNNPILKTCDRLLISRLSRTVNMRKQKKAMFSTKEKMFFPTFLVVLVVNILILCFGALYEFKRRSAPNIDCNDKVSMNSGDKKEGCKRQ